MLIEDANRLEKIDRLYSLRLDQLISLPVLAVVGDQSSGKSSVLEALTGLPFPRDSTLCTRFPTQIIFKRSPQRCIAVSIIPTAGTSHLSEDALGSFRAKLSRQDMPMESNELLAILQEATLVMGLSGENRREEEEVKSFSKDLLKIEISGPEHDHFSVIDLPGLFRKPTIGQTTKEDMLLVRDMVSTHLNNERSIILAVIPANVDIATQEIIQMAEDADPGRRRTLAVLTKPDLVDKGAEEHVIALVNKTNSSPGLGYVLVCNRSQRDLNISLSERHANERSFFSKLPWDTISRDRAGVTSLKKLLNNLTVDASRRSFEEVSVEIIRKIHTTRKSLDVLGDPRQTADLQRIFLLQLTSEYQSLINKATDAHYGRDECFHRNSSLRLATIISEESEAFSAILFRRGAYRVFTTRDSSAESDSEGEQTPDSADSEEDNTVESEGELHRKFPELRQFVQADKPDPAKDDESIDEWIARKYLEFRGFEVGGTNPSLITALVYEQTSGWHHFASGYVISIIKCIHHCIHDLLAHVCPDHQEHNQLWNHLIPKLMESYEGAVEHTKYLVDVERSGYPITLNHYFAQTMTKRRKQRIEQSLKKMKAWQTSDAAKEPLLRLDDVLNSFASNEEQNVEELGDILQSYYKVARKRFADNICKQVVDYGLICSKTGPLHLFSAEFVGKLNEEDLQKLAGENSVISEQRKQLQAELDILEQGRMVLQQL